MPRSCYVMLARYDMEFRAKAWHDMALRAMDSMMLMVMLIINVIFMLIMIMIRIRSSWYIFDHVLCSIDISISCDHNVQNGDLVSAARQIGPRRGYFSGWVGSAIISGNLCCVLHPWLPLGFWIGVIRSFWLADTTMTQDLLHDGANPDLVYRPEEILIIDIINGAEEDEVPILYL